MTLTEAVDRFRGPGSNEEFPTDTPLTCDDIRVYD